MRLVRATLRLMPMVLVASFLLGDGIRPAPAQTFPRRAHGRRLPVRKGNPPPPVGNSAPNPLSRLFRNLLGDSGNDPQIG